MTDKEKEPPHLRILIKMPTRSRPETAVRVLTQYLQLADRKDDIYMVTYDDTDRTMNNPAMKERLRALCPKMVLNGGTSTSKINACNRGIHLVKEEWHILVLASDDMECVKQGWDTIIRTAMAKNFPDTDGALWFWDGDKNTEGKLCTMNIMGYKLWKRLGYVYNPEYSSLWCDNEYTDVIRMLEKVVYSRQVLFKHEHFSNNANVKADKLMVHNQSFYHADERVYRRRKTINFGIQK